MSLSLRVDSRRGAASNVFLAVVALALSWSIWLLARSSVTEEAEIQVLVEPVVDGDDDLHATPDVESVKMIVRGPAREIGVLRQSARKDRVVFVRVTPRDIQPDTLSTPHRAGADDVSAPFLDEFEGLQLVGFVPEKIPLTLVKYETKQLEVRSPDVDAAKFPNVRIRIDSVTERVRVRGPASAMREMLELRTEINELVLNRHIEAMGNDIRRAQQIALEPVVKRGVAVQGELTASIVISRMQTKDVWVSLEIFVEEGNEHRWEFGPSNVSEYPDAFEPAEDGRPARLRVTLVGAPNSLAAAADDKLEGIVLAKDLPAQGGTRRLHLLIPIDGVELDRHYDVALVPVQQ